MVLTNFWGIVSSSSIFTKFLEINSNIYVLSRDIKLIWNELKVIAPCSLESSSIYCDYLINCQNATLKSRSIYMKALMLKERIRNMDDGKSWQCPYRYIFNDDTLVVRASASKENFGKIMDVSKNC